MPGIPYQDGDAYRQHLSPEQNAGIDAARKADQVKRANEETVRQRYQDPNLMSKYTWDQLVTAGKNGTLPQLGFPDLHFNEQTGKFDTPSMFNDHAITLNPDGKGGIKPVAEPAHNGWIKEHKHELWAAAAVVATVLTAGAAGGLLGATEVGGQAVVAADAAAVASGGTSIATTLAEGGMTALNGLAPVAVEGGATLGTGLATNAVADAVAQIVTVTGHVVPAAGLSAAEITSLVAAGGTALTAAGTPAGTPAAPSNAPGSGNDVDQTVEVNGQKPPVQVPPPPGTGVPSITPIMPPTTVPGAEPVKLDPPKADPPKADPPKEDPPKEDSKLTPDQIKKIAQLVKLGLTAAAATKIVQGAHTEGTPTATDPNTIIQRQLATADGYKNQMAGVNAQTAGDLTQANSAADSNAATLGALASDSATRGNALQSNYDNVINPALQKNLAQSQAYTDKALGDNAATMGNLQGNAGDLQSQWKNFMYPQGKQVVQQGADFTKNALAMTGKTAADAGTNATAAQNDWNTVTNPAFKQQLADSKVTSDAATKKFNDFAAQNGEMISNLRDRMGMSEPLIKKMITQAMEYNTEGNVERQAGLALGDNHTQFDNQRAQELQKLQSYGVDPTSGRYAGTATASRNNEAASSAAAATRARDAAVALGWQKSLDAVAASNSSNAAYQTYNQLASTQSSNVQQGLTAQNSNIDNLSKYTTATNTNADTQAKYGATQNGAINTGEAANSTQMGNVAKLVDMSKTYNDSYNSIARTMNDTSAAGQGLSAGQFSNIKLAGDTTNSFNNAANENSKTTSGLVTNQNNVINGKLTNDGKAADIYSTGAKTASGIDATAGQQAVGLYTANKVADSANAAGYGKLAGNLLDKYGGTIASGAGDLVSSAGSGLADAFVGSDWL